MTITNWNDARSSCISNVALRLLLQHTVALVVILLTASFVVEAINNEPKPTIVNLFEQQQQQLDKERLKENTYQNNDDNDNDDVENNKRKLSDTIEASKKLFKQTTSTTNKSQSTPGNNTKPHTNNWAVLVCSSRYWYNYRHIANVLSIYRSVKRLGIDDSHIILMLADDMACNARNPTPGTIFNNAHHHINVYGNDAEVDYRGEDVTVQNFLALLTNRHSEGTQRSKKLLTDANSNILIYLTGHGGNGFLKFQDKGELSSKEVADAFAQMHLKGRYNEILFIVDTCQAESMSSKLYSPNVIGVGSSKIGQDSLSHHGDPTIGVYVIDRYTFYVLSFLESLSVKQASNTTLDKFFKVCPESVCSSTVTLRLDLYNKDPSKVPITNFFGHKIQRTLVQVPEESLWYEML